MHVDNTTGKTAGYAMGMDPDGREYLILAVKGSYDFPDVDSESLTPAERNQDLFLADEFWGEPGHSAPRYELDYALAKARCDVLLNGSAHAPDGRPATRVRAGLRIEGWSKVIDVVGDRVWTQGVVAPGITDPAPFRTKPITYDTAFGGVDDLDPEDSLPDAFMANPIGQGWHRLRNQNIITGAPLPNTEVPGEPINTPWDPQKPMGFGPLGRGWTPRLTYAGTYDQAWIDNVFPFLPADFDPRYYQAAPEDQQIPYPRGGERVVLANLTPEGRTQFRLPDLHLPLAFLRKGLEDAATVAQVDTILIEPDQRQVHLTWRAALPLHRDIFEVTEVIVGARSTGFWRAKRQGKAYFRSLAELVDSKTGGGQ